MGRGADGEGELVEVQEKHRQLAGEQFAADHLPAAQPQYQSQGEGEVQRHPGAVGALHPLGVVVFGPQFFGLAVVLGALVVFRSESLDYVHSRQIFLQDGDRLAHYFLHVQPLAAEGAHYQGGAQHDGRDENHTDQRQLPVDGEKDGGDGDYADDYVQRPDHPQVDETAHRLYVGGSAGHQVAGVLFVVEGEADVLQFVVKQVAAVKGYFLRQGFGGVSAPEVAESPAEAHGEDSDAEENQRPDGEIELDEFAGKDVAPDHQVDGVAEQPGQGQGKADGDQRGDIGEDKPQGVPGGHPDDASEDSHQRRVPPPGRVGKPLGRREAARSVALRESQRQG